MTEIIEPNCSKRDCAHLTGVKEISGSDHRPVCNAFPEGIPDEIAYGSNRHLLPLPDQKNDIVYEKKQEKRKPS